MSQVQLRVSRYTVQLSSPLASSKVGLEPQAQDFHSCYRTSGPQKGFRRVSEGVSEGVSEAFLKGSFRVSEGVSRRTLPNPFKNPSKTLQEDVDIDDALGFPGLSNQLQVQGSCSRK